MNQPPTPTQKGQSDDRRRIWRLLDIKDGDYSVLLVFRQNFNVVYYQQIHREVLDELMPNLIVVVIGVWSEEGTVALARFGTRSVYNVEKILAGINNPSQLYKQSTNHSQADVRFGIADLAID